VFEDDDDRHLLVRGIAAAKANSRNEARFFLELALKSDPPLRSRIEAWRNLAAITDDPSLKRGYLEKILAADPTDATARCDLAVLDKRLDAGDIIDPENLTAPTGSPQSPRDRPFTCRHCGSGRLVFSPQGGTLVCEHCHQTETLESPLQGDVAGGDFVATMWTARAHLAPVATRAFSCRGCGASFVVTQGQLSLTCPYCASVHVTDRLDTRQLIAPNATIPFHLDRDEAQRRLESWAADLGVDVRIRRLLGAFEPIWILTFIGEIRWTGTTGDDTFGPGSDYRAERQSGAHTVIDHIVRVPARRGVPGSLAALINDFDVAALLPYDPQQLAGWPLAAYDVSLEDAAMLGRPMAVKALRAEVLETLGTGIRDVSMSFSGMAVDSFRLALLPVWIAELMCGDSRRQVLISGQTGTIRESIPS
jgi:DNA-directed RNA polymerase subunit RPC12/RpoP